MNRSFKFCAVVAALAAGPVFAQNAGDVVLSVGARFINPQDSSKPLQLVYPRQTVLIGSGSSVENSRTIGFGINYFFSSNWAGELAMGLPPKVKLQGAGTLAQVGLLGEAKQLSPALLGKYYFGEGNSVFRPFIGGGVSYVRYSNIKITQGLHNAFTRQLGAPSIGTQTTADLKSSFVPVAVIGAAYKINENWGLSGSVSYTPLKGKATITTSTLTGIPIAVAQSNMKIRPITTSLQVTYRF